MSTKAAPAFNVLEQAEGIASEAWEKTKPGINALAGPLDQVKKAAVKEAQTVLSDTFDQANFLRSLYSPDNLKSKDELEAIEREEHMEQTQGYARRLKELKAMKEGLVTEETIDPETQAKINKETQEDIQKQEKKLHEDFMGFERDTREAAKELGQPNVNAQAQQDTQRKQAEEAEAQRKKQEEEERLKAELPETASKPSPGSAFGAKKRPKQRMMAKPKATQMAEKSMESRSGLGVGG